MTWVIVGLVVVYAAILLALGLCRAARLGDEQIRRLGRGFQGSSEAGAGPMGETTAYPRPDDFEYGHRVHEVDGRRVYEVRR